MSSFIYYQLYDVSFCDMDDFNSSFCIWNVYQLYLLYFVINDMSPSTLESILTSSVGINEQHKCSNCLNYYTIYCINNFIVTTNQNFQKKENS